MDLLKELAKTINFTFDLALSPDGQFGNYVIKNASGRTEISFEFSFKIIIQNLNPKVS